MLHVLANNSDSGKTALCVHWIHGSCLYLLGKLVVEHAHCLVGILVAHTYRRRVLRRSLRHHEHRYAIFGKGSEDAAVDTYHSHHRQSGDGDERSAVDTRYTLNRLAVVVNLVFDNRSGVGRIERVLHSDRYILHAHGIDGRRIDNLGTEVAKLHRLYITQLGDGVCSVNHPGVGSHESVDIRPYLKCLGVESGSDDRSRVVASASS